MEQKTLSLKNEKVNAFYNSSLEKFRKQYKDVDSLIALHVNKDGKVFSGEWLDSKGIINFCGGYAIDCVKTIRFKNFNFTGGQVSPQIKNKMKENGTTQTVMHFATPDTGVKKTNIYYIPWSKLQLAKDNKDESKKWNRRVDLGPKEELEELMKSLYEQGPREPLKGKKVVGEEMYNVYEGERRFTAAQMAFRKFGVDIIFPVLLYPGTATWKDIAFDNLLSNDGKPFNPLERSESVKRLIDQGATDEEAAEGMGVSKVYINNLLRLASLPDKAKKLITDGVISSTELMQFLKKKNLDLDSLIEEIQEAAKRAKNGKVKAKDLRKKGEEEDEETDEDRPTRAASSIGQFKLFIRQNPGTYKDKRAQEEFEFFKAIIENQVSYSQILEHFTGK